jgi:hypothetical protein
VKRRVYIETTVVSYLTAWPARDLIVAAHQTITREWWERRRADFDLVASEVVVAESAAGDPDAAERRLRVLADLPRLEISPAVRDLAAAIIRGGALPAKAAQDAFHIAVCAVHAVDFLLTWNCTHIAHAESLPRVREVIESLGHFQPVICTPEGLLEVRDEL